MHPVFGAGQGSRQTALVAGGSNLGLRTLHTQKKFIIVVYVSVCHLFPFFVTL